MINVQCIEPDSLPLKTELEVRLLERFRLYVLSDVRHSSGSSLRSTILLPFEQNPPPEALLMLEMDVYNPGAGDPPLFRARRMGARCFVDVVRPNVRSRLREGGEIPSGSRLEAILQDSRRITVTMQMETDLMRSSNAVGGGSMRHKAAKDVSSGWFLYNSLASLLTLNWIIIKSWLEKWARRLGIHPWVIIVLMSIMALILLALYSAYNRNKAAEAAEEEVVNLEESQENLEKARSNALDNEMACLAERQALASRLKDIDEKKRLLASQALAYSFTQSMAVENGGSRMMAKDVLSFDKQFQETLESAVVVAMDSVRVDPGEMSFCMEQDSVLGMDLPKYILTWHPDVELVCPLQYSVIDSGINRMGSWGLSSRVAKEFGAQNLSEGGAAASVQLGEQLGDPRMAARWSASTLAIGLRKTQFTLLTMDTGSRPPVSPSQAHIWSLTLWDAYNRLPSPASGVMDKPIEYCVEELVNAMIASPEPAVPGSPLLPDVTLIASGEKKINVTPSPSCPWPADVFEKSANSAIQAVANMSHFVDFAANNENEDDE
jgi:hypothetical protein